MVSASKSLVGAWVHQNVSINAEENYSSRVYQKLGSCNALVVLLRF